MGAYFASFFRKKDPKTPIKGCGPRIKNLFLRHHRGIVGSLVPLIVLPLFLKKGIHSKTVKVMWMWMFWFFLLQPVNIPVTGLIPVFMLPMCGAMSSDATCGCYMSEGIAMFIVGNMVLLLWNNSGLDRRLILWFLCSGDTPQFSAKRLVFKCCTAGYFLSIFSNKLIVTNIMTQYMTPILTNLQASTSRASEPNFDEVRYIVNNAIQTSCCIGSIAIIHSSYATLTFRTIFQTTALNKNHAWEDIFNYLEYTSFALPLSIALIIFNIGYHTVIVGMKSGKPMSVATMTKVRNTLWNHKKDIPKNVTLHEKLSLLFSIIALIFFFGRWTKYFPGWGKTFGDYNGVPGLRDATVAAMFVVLLHSLPNGFRFLKIWSAKKKSQFGTPKPESAILWWRFVDKNITYGYIFLIGSGVAISAAAFETKLSIAIADGPIGKIFTNQGNIVYYLLISLFAVLLPNIMSSVAAVVIFLPFVMCLHAKAPPAVATVTNTRMSDFDDIVFRDPVVPAIKLPKLDTTYLAALTVGIGGSFGFMFPFLYTPSYFTYHTGKVPKKKMAIYGVGSAIICLLLLWVFIAFYAPILWNADNIKIKQIKLPTTKATTVATP